MQLRAPTDCEWKCRNWTRARRHVRAPNVVVVGGRFRRRERQQSPRHSTIAAPNTHCSWSRGPGDTGPDVAAVDGAHRQCRSVRLLALPALVDDRAKRRLQPRPARVSVELKAGQSMATSTESKPQSADDALA